jgi:hypothetical protein
MSGIYKVTPQGYLEYSAAFFPAVHDIAGFLETARLQISESGRFA